MRGLLCVYAPARYLCGLTESKRTLDFATIQGFTELMGQDGIKLTSQYMVGLAVKKKVVDPCTLVADTTREYVLSRLQTERLSRVTMDFDGPVISTGRFAEGTAVGYNNKRKGERSYYPLLRTIAQTAKVLDVFHRAGNLHDSHNALAIASSS